MRSSTVPAPKQHDVPSGAAAGVRASRLQLSTLGHPLTNLAYYVLPCRLTDSRFRGMAEHIPLPAGIPDEATYLCEYSRLAGTPIGQNLFEFCVAYRLFRLAAILRESTGGRRTARARRQTPATTRGRRARPTAEIAWRQVKAHFREAD